MTEHLICAAFKLYRFRQHTESCNSEPVQGGAQSISGEYWASADAGDDRHLICEAFKLYQFRQHTESYKTEFVQGGAQSAKQ